MREKAALRPVKTFNVSRLEARSLADVFKARKDKGELNHMDDPLVSVVICTYNMAQYLPQAIQSVLGQTYKMIELIIIDDGSCDDTADVVKSFGDRLTYAYQINQGVSIARNLGIEYSHGELIAFLDADDLWLPQKIQTQVTMFLERPDIGVVAVGARIADASGAFISDNIVYDYKDRGIFVKALSICQIVPGSVSSALISKKCFETVGTFDPSLRRVQDWDMWNRISRYYDIAIIPVCLCIIRITVCGKDDILDYQIREEITVAHRYAKGTDKLRSWAASYYRLASARLGVGHHLRALSALIYSIILCPFELYPKNIFLFKTPGKDDRWYLLLRCFVPNRFIKVLKHHLLLINRGR